jgi:hypothetical protein
LISGHSRCDASAEMFPKKIWFPEIRRRGFRVRLLMNASRERYNLGVISPNWPDQAVSGGLIRHSPRPTFHRWGTPHGIARQTSQ